MQTTDEHAGRLILSLCGCGRFHFSYGPITIHLGREEFLALAEQIAQTAGFLKGATTASASEFHVKSPSSVCH